MRTPAARVRTRLAAAGAVLALGSGLAGCGSDPSVVAYVGDARVTQSQLDDGVAGVNQALTQGNQIPVGDVANVLIHGQIAEQIAAEKSITITDSQRDEAIAQRNLTVLLANPEAKAVIYDSATEQLVATRLGEQAYLAELAKIPVTLNPRYGTLNPQTKVIVENSSGSLSIPLARAGS